MLLPHRMKSPSLTDCRRSLLRRALLVLLVFLPAIFLAVRVKENAVDIACWDMWENGELLKKFHDGQLGWKDLYAAQIQHRIVIPRLLIIAMAKLSGGDFRVETWAAFSMLLLGGILVYRLLRLTLGNSAWVPGLAFVANLVLFTPMLYQNILWGSSLWMAIPMPCLLGALLILSREGVGWKGFAAAVLLMEIATHSFSHGLAMWPLLLTYILCQPRVGNLKKRGLFAGVWALIAVVTISCYLTHFYNTAFHAYDLKIGDHALSGGVSDNFKQTLGGGKAGRAIQCFFAYLGSLYARNPFDPRTPLDRAVLIGQLLMAVFLALVLVLLATRRGRSLWRQSLPWLALASYAIGVGLLVGFGRTATVEGRALTARYISVAMYLPVSILALGFLVARSFSASSCGARLNREHLRRGAVAFLAATAVIQVPVWSYGSHLMRVWKTGRLQGKGLAMFINTVDLENAKDVWEPLDKIDRNGHQLDAKAQINTLKSLGLYKTPLLETAELKHFQLEKKPLELEKADLLGVAAVGENLEIRGYARFALERPADLVLFTDAATGRILHLGQPETRQVLNLYGLDYEFTRHPEALPLDTFAPFTSRLPLAKLPEGETNLEAWALDVQSMRVRRIARSLRIAKAAGTPPAVQLLPASKPE